tara:strand:- start:2374 stop:2637 length:264 start_codon:yes stop_codon:yes gene_type:complete
MGYGIMKLQEKAKYHERIMSDFDLEEEMGLSKDAALAVLLREDLEVHSAEVLKMRINLLQDEIKRTEEAIALKSDAQKRAEDFFKKI